MSVISDLFTDILNLGGALILAVWGVITWVAGNLWSIAVMIISQIPYIGPFFVFTTQTIGALLTEISFFAYTFIFRYPTTTLSAIFCIILLHSMVVGAQHGRHGPHVAQTEMIKTIASDSLSIVLILYRLGMMIVPMVTALIAAIIGLIP